MRLGLFCERGGGVGRGGAVRGGERNNQREEESLGLFWVTLYPFVPN